jgi:hypothetical protein
MEKWQYYLSLVFIIWFIGALIVAGCIFCVYAKPNSNSTVDNCTVETIPVKNAPVNPIVKNVTERIAEENNVTEDNETDKEDTPAENYSEEDNSLSPSEQIEQREREKREEAALAEEKGTKKDDIKEEDYQEETTERLSEPFENVDTSESITKENKLNVEAVKKSPERTDFVIHNVDGGKETFNASFYYEMKIGENGIVNFGEELEGAEIIVIPK